MDTRVQIEDNEISTDNGKTEVMEHIKGALNIVINIPEPITIKNTSYFLATTKCIWYKTHLYAVMNIKISPMLLIQKINLPEFIEVIGLEELFREAGMLHLLGEMDANDIFNNPEFKHILNDVRLDEIFNNLSVFKVLTRCFNVTLKKMSDEEYLLRIVHRLDKTNCFSYGQTISILNNYRLKVIKLPYHTEAESEKVLTECANNFLPLLKIICSQNRMKDFARKLFRVMKKEYDNPQEKCTTAMEVLDSINPGMGKAISKFLKGNWRAYFSEKMHYDNDFKNRTDLDIIFEPGSVLLVQRFQIFKTNLYDHAGVYLGEGRVAHVVSQLFKGKGKIFVVTDFAKYVGNSASIKELRLRVCKTPIEVIKHNVEHMTQKVHEYNLLSNNCEHLAFQCVGFLPFSTQI